MGWKGGGEGSLSQLLVYIQRAKVFQSGNNVFHKMLPSWSANVKFSAEVFVSSLQHLQGVLVGPQAGGDGVGKLQPSLGQSETPETFRISPFFVCPHLSSFLIFTRPSVSAVV